MSYLVDTNVLSELRKGARCDRRVARWYARVGEGDLFLSVLVVGEIRRGIERLRKRNPTRARAIDAWLGEIRRQYEDRILAVDREVAEEWGRLTARGPVPAVDGLIAATARVHDLVLVTRNLADFKPTGARLLDPFAF